MSPCWLTQGHASKAPLTNQSAHGLLRLLAANIMETITFSCSSHESDKWDKEQRSESKMAAMKCRLCLCSRSPEKGVNWHRIFFFFFFLSFLNILEGWTQTQLHISSSLIARCGSQTGKSSWAQTCFCFFGRLHEVTSYLTALFVSSLALLVLLFTIPADYVFLSRNVWNKKPP